MDAQRIHDIGAVHGNGICAETEIDSNFFIRFSRNDVLKNFQLARRQSRTSLAFQRCRSWKPGGSITGLPSGHSLYGAHQIEIHRIF